MEKTNSEQSEEKSGSSNSKVESSWKKWRPWIFLGGYILVCLVPSIFLWDQLRGDDSLADTLRNLGVGYGALAGVFIAVWRSTSADEQAAAAKAQVKTAEQQADAARNQVKAANAALEASKAREHQVEAQIKIAARRARTTEDQLTVSREAAAAQNEIADRRAVAAEGQLKVSKETAKKRVQAAEAQVAAAEEQEKAARQYGDAAKESAQDARYRRGVEALGHDEMSIRLAGVYELEALFHENCDKYGIRVIRHLCAFARNPPRLDARVAMYPPLGEDVQEIITFIGGKAHDTFQEINLDQKCKIDLRGAILQYADMRKTNMSDVDFSEAILIQADFSGATLTGAKFCDANILGADLTNAELNSDQLENTKHPKLVYGLRNSSSSE